MKIRNIKGKISKLLLFVLISAVLIACFSFCVNAEGAITEEDILSDFGEVIGDLSENVKERFPTEINTDDIGTEIVKMTSAEYLLDVVGEILDMELSSSVKLLGSLFAVLVLCGIFMTAKDSFGDSAIPGAVRFCTVSILLAIVIRNQYDLLIKVKEYFEQLNTLMLGMIPITGAAWAMGGNISTASTGTATMYIFLNISQYFFGQTVLPMAAAGTCLSFCGGIAPEMGMRRISASIRKTYVFCLGAIMTFFSAILVTQTAITSAADSTSARTAKFISSAIIPIVGGSVGDSLRTVASGVQYLKSILGVGGIMLIFIMVIPVLISLLLTRLCFMLSVSAAEFLGCGDFAGILGELAEVYSGIIAAVAITSVMFILAFFIFIKTTVAIM